MALCCYVCGEQLTAGERYEMVLLFATLNAVPVCDARDRGHEIMRAA